jgi:hypothetical protein
MPEARVPTSPPSAPFRFVLLRAPDDTDPRAAAGVVYRARAHGEHVWVMSLTPRVATHRSVALLLALLGVDQALLILPSQQQAARRARCWRLWRHGSSPRLRRTLPLPGPVRTRFFGQVPGLSHAARRVNSWRTSAGVR